MQKQKLFGKYSDWSSELAYAIGLIATDGCLSNDGRHIILRSSDIDQIETFKKCLGLSNKIGAPSIQGTLSSRICYRVQFGNVQFYRWLQKIGLFPAKSYTIGQLKIPDKYFRDFLRGHLDGDGSITTYEDRYNVSKDPSYVYTRLLVRFISVSQDHIQWLRNTISRLLNLKGDLHRSLPPKERHGVPMWQLKFMKKESIKLLNLLYYSDNIPALVRKRKKAEHALALISTTQRKAYTRKQTT